MNNSIPYGVIYKITNIINQKVYIGQTIQHINTRIRRHFRDASNGVNTVFCKAIRKYGEDNFTWEIIDTATNFEELNQKEIYWIYECNAYVNLDGSNGYNMKIGGEGLSTELNPNSKFSKAMIFEILELAKTGNFSVDMIANEFNMSSSSINNLFDKNNSWHKVILEIVSESEFNHILKQLRNCGKKIASEKISKKKSGKNHHMWNKKRF